MRSLPFPVRLTIPFALAMALVIVALAVFVYARVASALVESVDQALSEEAIAAIGNAGHGRALLTPSREDDEHRAGVAEIILPSGRVLAASPPGSSVLLGRRELTAVLAGNTLHLTRALPGRSGTWRLLAVPVRASGTTSALVLGGSLVDRDRTLDRLQAEFLLAAPTALILAILAGYWIARGALRPVEAMRRRADEISTSTAEARLPIPATHDEIARLAVTLNSMLDRLEVSFERERRFVADASHELRTPLTLLRTELELALLRPRSPEELEAALRSAVHETERLSALTNDLLLIARSDSGGLPVAVEPVSARELAETVVARFSSHAAALGRPLGLADGPDPVLLADPERLAQALGNLVENALAHGRGAVTVSIATRDDRVELSVADTGDGFSAAFAPRAFDRFSRAHDARSRVGAGLGLAIVAAIAAAHGGTATLTQAAPPVVTISIPAAPADLQGAGEEADRIGDRRGISSAGLRRDP